MAMATRADALSLRLAAYAILGQTVCWHVSLLAMAGTALWPHRLLWSLMTSFELVACVALARFGATTDRWTSLLSWTGVALLLWSPLVLANDRWVTLYSSPALTYLGLCACAGVGVRLASSKAGVAGALLAGSLAAAAAVAVSHPDWAASTWGQLCVSLAWVSVGLLLWTVSTRRLQLDPGLARWAVPAAVYFTALTVIPLRVGPAGQLVLEPIVERVRDLPLVSSGMLWIVVALCLARDARRTSWRVVACVAAVSLATAEFGPLVVHWGMGLLLEAGIGSSSIRAGELALLAMAFTIRVVGLSLVTFATARAGYAFSKFWGVEDQ